MPDPQNITASWGHAGPDQPDPAWLTTHFRHAVAARTFGHLQKFVVADRALATRTAPLELAAVRRWLTDPTGRWHRISADGQRCSIPRQCLSGATATAATPSRHHGLRHNHTLGRFRGEPDAERFARPVWWAAWGNGPEQPGHRAPGRPNRLEPQITVGLLTDASGFPLTVQAFAGNRLRPPRCCR